MGWGDRLQAWICLWGGITTDNVITLFEWDNGLSVDGVMNVGYDEGVRLMNILFALMKMN